MNLNYTRIAGLQKQQASVDALYDVFVNYFPHKFGGSCPSAPRIYLRECVFVCHSASVATTESIKHVRHAPGSTAAADVKL